jgi:bifunctional DNA-binding transcriptional regulator/antitoxin component of YhaV-PrlF toxin-antitoxin module
MRTANVRPVGPRNQVTLPKEALELFKIRPHDLIAFVYTREGILIKPVTVVDKNASFAEEDLDEIERSIRQQVSAGDFTGFSGSKKAVSFLKGKK